MTTLNSKLVPIGRLIQRRLLWVCNRVPFNLFEDDFVMPAHNNSVYTDDNNDDIIFDTVNVTTNNG